MSNGRTTLRVARRARRGVVGALIAVLVLTGCGSAEDEPVVLSGSAETSTTIEPSTTSGPAETTTTAAEEDAPQETPTDPAEGSRVPCRHFRSITGNPAQAASTDAGIQRRVQLMSDSAEEATPAVQEAVEEMVRAVSDSNADDYVAAAGPLDEACAEAGY